MGPRERLEWAQAMESRLAPHVAVVEPHPEIGRLEDECAQLEAGLRAVRRDVEAHRAQHRRWDEVREGRRLHLIAWPATLMCLVLTSEAWTNVARLNGALVLTSVLASIEAVAWVRRARRSRQLREEGGGWPDEPLP